MKKDKTIKEDQSEIVLQETEKARVTTETQGKAEVKKKRKIEEKEAEEKRIEVIKSKEKRIEENESKENRIESDEGKEKRKMINEDNEKRIEINEMKEKQGIIAKIRGKKKPETEEAPESEMTTREKLHWGLEAYKSLRRPLFRLFSDLLNGIKIKRLESYMTFGLADPADTGILCGCIHAVAGMAYSRCRHCSFSINPVFMNPMMDFRGEIEIRVRIYSLIFPMLKFIFNGKTLSFTYSIIKEKLWGKRKFLS
ncbi:DUF2953 domain-containing protein [Methanosarcina sp. UBA5]|uniref:DUF2953 domain-containing protein n=1 Tax=Methanosarcina sp. UBA5 TaxID=1915593 RepID=UPI0025F1F271|nr:DUF2953 domain-containing protein [Methanosarcina sp. UBA5]